jgi:hypothetical protein
MDLQRVATYAGCGVLATAREAYWTERGWATDAPIKVSSRIDTPKPLATLDAGRTVIGGVAWAQHRDIGHVEVRVDGGPWQEARLGPSAGIDYWRQWYLPWEATPGRHRVAVRATTRDGEVQTAARTSPYPEGSSGIQGIVVTRPLTRTGGSARQRWRLGAPKVTVRHAGADGSAVRGRGGGRARPRSARTPAAR